MMNYHFNKFSSGFRKTQSLGLTPRESMENRALTLLGVCWGSNTANTEEGHVLWPNQAILHCAEQVLYKNVYLCYCLQTAKIRNNFSVPKQKKKKINCSIVTKHNVIYQHNELELPIATG